MAKRKQFLVVWVMAFCTWDACAAPKPVRTMLHGNMAAEPPTEEHLRFIEDVKPDILVMGVFDQRLYSLASPRDKTKAQSPDDLLARWKVVADRLHRKGIGLIGQMEINVLSDRPADLTDSTGFLGYFDKQWDEKRLGKRPARSVNDLLEEPDLERHAPKKDAADTTALCGCRVNLKAINACINKPSWRETQKRMVAAAAEIGVDGFITNRNYFGHCACEHCRDGFRRWLGDRYSAGQLKERFAVNDLSKHPLTCVVGMHRDPQTVPDALVIEKQRFIKHQVKDFFDEIYIKHGRKLRPDFFVGQWNHMAYFDELHLDRGHLPPSTRTSFAHAAADERWGLPADMWGRDESLIWYCNWGTTQNTILEKQYAGDTVLYGKLIRTLAQGKPFTVNKYDFYRPRNMMAEAAALGYVTNAIATPWQTDEDRAVMLRYFRFFLKHEAVLQTKESIGEVGLVFPRRALHEGDASPLEYIEAAGRSLIREHMLFDMLPDDMLAQLTLAKYRVIALSAVEYLAKAELEVLAKYAKAGGKILMLPVAREDRERAGAVGRLAQRWPTRGEPIEFDAVVVENARTRRDEIVKELVRVAGGADRFSRFEMSWTVEAHAYFQATEKRLVIHLVNYNHDEKGTGKSVVAREAPIAAMPASVRMRLPEGFKVKAVRFLSPDDEKEHSLEFRQIGAVCEWQSPRFLVYGVCVIDGN